MSFGFLSKEIMVCTSQGFVQMNVCSPFIGARWRLWATNRIDETYKYRIHNNFTQTVTHSRPNFPPKNVPNFILIVGFLFYWDADEFIRAIRIHLSGIRSAFQLKNIFAIICRLGVTMMGDIWRKGNNFYGQIENKWKIVVKCVCVCSRMWAASECKCVFTSFGCQNSVDHMWRDWLFPIDLFPNITE